MDIEKAKDQIKNYFETHSHAEIMKNMYGESVERMESFNASLWKDAIVNQVDIGDEELYYADKNEPNKKYLPLFDSWSALVDPKIPWQEVEESMFPTVFVIIEDNGKRVVFSIMVGQGSASSICSIDNFKEWMERCENEYTFDESKFITVDELEKVFKETIEEYEEMFKE
jgi:hypothetical protein